MSSASVRAFVLGPTLAIAALSLAQCGGPRGPIDGDKAMAHVRTMVGFGPRPFGSAALAKTTDYIEGELKKLGLSPQRHEVLLEKEKKTIRNLWVQIDGEDAKAGPVLMLGAHYDTKLAEGHADAAHNFTFLGAIDGGGEGPGVGQGGAPWLVAPPVAPTPRPSSRRRSWPRWARRSPSPRTRRPARP